MKICYLLQGRDDPETALQYALALGKEDYVVVTLNDEKWRNEAYFVLVKNKNILLSTSTPFSQEGDLSSARCWLYQMKDALEKFDFDLCVNLTEKTLPMTQRTDWMDMLQKEAITNSIRFDRDNLSDKAYDATMRRYFFSTNANKFATSEVTRKRARRTADLFYALGLRRKLKDTLYEGEPWFVFDKQTVMNFSDNLAFASENFVMAWYPERTVFQTMWKKFLGHKQIENRNFIAEGELTDGKYFKKYETLPARKEIAEILNRFQPLYTAPYEFVAEEIVEEDKRSMLTKTIDQYKNKKK